MDDFQDKKLKNIARQEKRSHLSIEYEYFFRLCNVGFFRRDHLCIRSALHHP
jgi:hypothetical protein